ncbi:MAG: four helix bundle protein [Flavobacteriaceae bacterium]
MDCWQKCRSLRIWVHNFLQINQGVLDDDLIQNLRRASRSTTRNLAEGFGRFHFKDNIRFCRISLGSLFEIKEDIIIVLDENRIKIEESKDGLQLVHKSIKSVLGYINYLKSKSKN